MKILVVQESDWVERGPHQSHHLMERMAKKGHEVRVIDYELLWRDNKRQKIISDRKIFRNVQKAVDGGKITVIRPPIIKLPFIEYISLIFTHRNEIKRQIEEFKPDVIVGFSILNANIAIRFAKKKGILFIYYILDELFRLVPQKHFWLLARLIEQKNMKNADKVLAINEQLRNYTIQMGAKRTNTALLRTGVDLERYDQKLSGIEIRNQYGIKANDTVLLFMGWLYNFSGLNEVVKELSRHSNEPYHHIKLLIVGEGDSFADLQKIRREHGLEDQVILAGRQPYEKIPEFIAAADICLLPAYSTEKIMQNIVPIKMYEYMIMKKPVIATKLPGIMKEFGLNHGIIYVTKPEDVLDKAVEMVESGTLEEHGSKARKFVENYSWDNVVNDFEMILKEII